jgi:hypothetical protein
VRDGIGRFITSGIIQTKSLSSVAAPLTVESLHRLASLRSKNAKRGPILANGETFKDWARDGLKWWNIVSSVNSEEQRGEMDE